MATTNRKLIKRLTVLVLLLVGAFCAEAQTKIFAGSFCVEETINLAQAVVVQEKRIFRFRGDVCNFFEPELQVICPIVRDLIIGGLTSATVTFEDGNQMENPVCTLNVLDLDNFPDAPQAPITSQPAPTGITTIQFGPIVNRRGPYWLDCSLPRSTCLLSYQTVDSVR